MRRSLWIICAAAGNFVVTATSASAQSAYTTRIETRAVYGATVTIEEGVRVFRPLPSEQHVIVNPGGKTPLSLGYYTYDDTRWDPRFAPGTYAVPVPYR